MMNFFTHVGCKRISPSGARASATRAAMAGAAVLIAAATCIALPAYAQADKLTPGLASQPRVRVVLADRIVAVVNDDIVTLRQLVDRVRMVKLQFKRDGTPPPADEVLEKSVLERLIVDRAQEQFAREIGLRVDDATLNSALENIAKGNNLTMAQFRDALERLARPHSFCSPNQKNHIMKYSTQQTKNKSSGLQHTV